MRPDMKLLVSAATVFVLGIADGWILFEDYCLEQHLTECRSRWNTFDQKNQQNDPATNSCTICGSEINEFTNECDCGSPDKCATCGQELDDDGFCEDCTECDECGETDCCCDGCEYCGETECDGYCEDDEDEDWYCDYCGSSECSGYECGGDDYYCDFCGLSSCNGYCEEDDDEDDDCD